MGETSRSETIGIDLETCWVPLLDVYVNETGPFRFAVDTGYSGPNLSATVAASLGLMPDGNGHVQLNAMRVGRMRFADYEIHVSDNSRVSEILGTDIGGILGMGFMKYFETAIDYRSSTISFSPVSERIGKHCPADPEFSYVRTKYIANYVIVPVFIGGDGPHDFLLDTGARLCNIAHGTAAGLGLPIGRPHSARAGGGVRTVRASRIADLAVGAQHASYVEASIMEDAERSQYTGADIVGFLGHSFLKNFRIVFSPLDLFFAVGV